MSARRSLVAAAVLVGVVLAGLGASEVGSQGARSGPGSGPAAAVPTDPSRAQVVATTAARDAVLPLLAARAAALRAGDLRAWLAPVDPRQPALVRAQTVLFGNLRQLPLVSYGWSADPRAPAEGYPVESATARAVPQPGVAALAIPGLRLTYQLRGFDQAPVEEPYAPLVLRRDGRWYLGEDRTGQATFGAGRVEPWTLGPVRVAVTRHALVIVSARDSGRLRSLASTADSAVTSVSSMWRSGWSRTAVLYATRDEQVFATFLGRDRDVDDADGLTLGTGPFAHARPHDDTRVVVNTRFVPPGSRRMYALLRHEFTHVALWNTEGDGVPTWAVEGIAEYTAYRSDPQAQRVSARIGKDARAHRLAATLPDSATFYGGAAQGYHYGIAWLAWEYLGETYGDTRVRALYHRLSAISAPQGSAAALAAEDRAFVAVLHLSERSYVKRLGSWAARVLTGG